MRVSILQGRGLRRVYAVLLVVVFAGCDGNGIAIDRAIPALPPPPVSQTGKTHGSYRGVATVAGKAYHAEGLRTEDGAVRIHVGAELQDGGVTLRSGAGPGSAVVHPDDAWQFVGSVGTVGGAAQGSGVIIGQACAAPGPGRFCDGAVAAEIVLPDAGDGLNGEIRVATSAGTEVWALDMGYTVNWYETPARLAGLGGNFVDRLAQVSLPDAMVLNGTGAGELFFQSAGSGCTANGTSSPHLAGDYHVFDLEISIRNCDAAFGHLNNDFTGFATSTPSGHWDYDTWLIVYLATPASAPSQAAITLFAEQQ